MARPLFKDKNMKASLLDWLIAAIAFIVICAVFSLVEPSDSNDLSAPPAATASAAAALRADVLVL
jgi:hypothetical protein